MVRWTMKGQYMEACSCDFLCPCIPKNATTPATHDFCKVALAFAVDAGSYGDVRLAGVRFVFFAQSKAVMSQGDWIGGLIIDAAASDAQVEAVTAIASGAAGGAPAPPGPPPRGGPGVRAAPHRVGGGRGGGRGQNDRAGRPRGGGRGQ